MKTPVPIPCPKCGGKLNAVTHDGVALKILKERCWYMCTSTECGYCEDVEKFKSKLFVR